LSACRRSFNQDIFETLGSGLKFSHEDPDFLVLTRFSFVAEADREGWFRIHDLLQRLIRERREEVTYEAHGVLERYYRQRGERDDEVGVAEAIYHANRLDWQRGVEEWVTVFDDVLRMSRYALCRALLAVRGDLVIEGDFQYGQVSVCKGDYFARLAVYTEAR